ncbi:putative rRNA methyltransferase YqxC [Nitrospira sp. KM1]|uniref:TlyA family RNA methyltransferase n=1 Tax=Nitrospira sp. KM1 TaxID=1936990 RepID=UPI0013A73268|nr:TlyA family RNA methyltransferase [Nitrospira sp. KM1]BCA54723.1 putative rRNA methyltransferase YqxC [Nitrospira sp. KM1]
MVPPLRAQKERLDRLVVIHGLAESRESAVRAILAGDVSVDGTVVDKPAKLVAHDARINVALPPPYVSRAGEKLAAALSDFLINPSDSVCLDVGCSTGGFTDCLLQRGAKRIYAVDVGYGQIHWRLRQDTRVILLERTNIRYVDRSTISERIGLAVLDVSFISLALVLPSVVGLLADEAKVIALVKPQFEVGKGNVGAGGIVRDDAQRERAVRAVVESAKKLGLSFSNRCESPLKGRKGNREILVAFDYRSRISLEKDLSASSRTKGEA